MKKPIRDLAPRGIGSAGAVSNWHLNLKNVGRCPACGGLVEMPCKLCAAREARRVKRRMAELRERDAMAIHRSNGTNQED